jgi:hypothetical protein
LRAAARQATTPTEAIQAGSMPRRISDDAVIARYTKIDGCKPANPANPTDGARRHRARRTSEWRR